MSAILTAILDFSKFLFCAKLCDRVTIPVYCLCCLISSCFFYVVEFLVATKLVLHHSVIFKCFESRAARARNCDSFAISFVTFQFTPGRVIYLLCFAYLLQRFIE